MSTANLHEKLSRGRAKPAELGDKVFDEYCAEKDTSYRDLAERHGIGLGTVRRMIRERADALAAAATGRKRGKK